MEREGGFAPHISPFVQVGNRNISPFSFNHCVYTFVFAIISFHKKDFKVYVYKALFQTGNDL